MHPVRRRVALTLAGLCLAAGLAAAEPQGREVLLDVLVAQANGSVLVGLDKEDFIVLEDGKPVDIEGVTFYSDHAQLRRAEIPERLALKLEDIPQERYFILLFHEQTKILTQAGQTFGQRQEAGRAAREWLKTLLPNDFVAVLGFDTKLVAYSDFTRDPETIAAAIEGASSGRNPETPPRPASEGRPSLLARLPEGRALVARSGTILGALELIGHAAEAITGRKNLLVFTEGFGQRSSRLGASEIEISEAVLALNGGNVSVYPVDLLNRASPTREMWILIGETGGRFFENFREALQIVSAENAGYYLLRYHAGHRGRKRGLQRVQVTTTLPSALVRVRSGYPFKQTGLGPGDLTVQKDDKPVEVTGVTVHSQRYFLLLFEVPKVKPTASSPYLQAAQRARKWLQQELRPDDWVAVMSHQGKLELHQDFTRDRQALSRAVGAVMTGEKGREIATSPAGSPSLHLPRDLRSRTRTISGSLEVLGEAAREIPGRKNLVLFTDRLDEDRPTNPQPY